jgi:hypothetical protein
MFVTKRCGKCGETKPVELFHRWKRSDGYQPWCKACRKVYDKAFYERTIERRLARLPQVKAEFAAWYASLKEGKPCADCGGVFPPQAMHFDHPPGVEKVANVGDLARKRSRQKILAEVAKCDLVCANCHAVRTVSRRTSGRGAAW